MVEGYVLDAVETTSGDIWYKARSSDDRVYYVKQGEGIVGWGNDSDGQSRYAAAKSHSLESSVSERGVDPERIIDRMEKTSDRRTSPTKGLERGSLARELGGDKNKLLGYVNQKYGAIESQEEWIEAIEDYSEFVDEIGEASTQEERQDIKREFGVGDS